MKVCPHLNPNLRNSFTTMWPGYSVPLTVVSNTAPAGVFGLSMFFHLSGLNLGFISIAIPVACFE